MTLEILKTKGEIRSAYCLLQKTFLTGKKQKTVIGHKGFSGEMVVSWHRKLGIWIHFAHDCPGEAGKERYWCAYGVDVPKPNSMVNITAEINMYKKWNDRKVAAAFAKNPDGDVYLIHTGKVGGGRTGIGKETFRDYFPGSDQYVSVRWPDGVYSDEICIGKVGDRLLLNNVSHFVKEVDKFKTLVTQGKLPETESVEPLEGPNFTPEFSGKRKKYTLNGSVEANCTHGQVVSALNSELKSKGHKTASDRSRDLFILKGKKVNVLFEVKTDLTTTSIYGAIGQLMYHGAAQKSEPKRVLVVPGKPGKKTQKILQKLGIKIVEYTWHRDLPVFKKLNY